MASIFSLLRNPETLLAFKPQELAGYVLEFLNSLPEHEKENLHGGNFTLSHMLRDYPSQYHKSISEALMEAWAWLEHEGLLVPKPGQSGNFRNISRKGQELKNHLDVEKYRKKKLLSLGATNVPDMTPQENSKKKKYGYKTDDVLTFLRRDELKRSHIVQINKGKPFEIPNPNVDFLLLMAITLKENKGGWVTPARTKKDGLTDGTKRDFHKIYRWVSNLRKVFTDNKLENSNLFVEGVKSTDELKYRISTHPDNIKEPTRGWLKQEYKRVLEKRKLREKEAKER